MHATRCKRSNETVSGVPPDPDYVCPACRGDILRGADSYQCRRCGRTFPIIFDIPDFRLDSDAYLDLESERAKAAKLAERAPHLSFSELVDYYYSITDDVPATLASTYKRSIMNGPEHLLALADDLDDDDGTLLDAGCGSGSLLVALADSRRPVIGLDIALRWLVLCRKRLQEAGLYRQLVCADILQPPFRERSVAAVAGIDLIEHTRDIELAARALAALVRPGGRLWLTVSNRYTVGPHPATRLWAVGYLPRRFAGRVSNALRGVDSLRHVQLTTPRQVASALKRSGFGLENVQPRRISGNVRLRPPPFERALIGAYRLLCRRPLSRRLLVWIGPVSEIVARIPDAQPRQSENIR